MKKMWSCVWILVLGLIFIRPSIFILGLPIEYVVYLGVLSYALIGGHVALGLKHMLPWLIPLAYVTIIVVVVNSEDWEMMRRLGRTSADVLVVSIVAHRLWVTYEKKAIEVFLYTICGAGFVQGVVMVLMYVSPSIQDIIHSVIYTDPLWTAHERVSGLQSRGGDGLALNQALSGLAALFLFALKGRTRYLFYGLFIVVASLLAARSGVAAFVVAGFIFVVMGGLKNTKAKTLIKIALVLLVVATGSVSTLDKLSKDVSRGYSDPVVRAFEPVRNWRRTGAIETSSTNKLLNEMIFLPSGRRLYVGNGEYGREGGEYIRSDIGYIRMLHGMGIIGLMVLSIPFILIALQVRMAATWTSVLVFGLIAHFKIVYLISGAYVVFLLGCAFLIARNRGLGCRHRRHCRRPYRHRILRTIN